MARTKAQQEEARERLREWLQPGDVVYTILKHVSSSGMNRRIAVKLIRANPEWEGGVEIRDLTWNVAQALGWRFHEPSESISVTGCGQDMGFHLVYTLASVLFPGEEHNGYALTQKWL